MKRFMPILLFCLAAATAKAQFFAGQDARDPAAAKDQPAAADRPAIPNAGNQGGPAQAAAQGQVQGRAGNAGPAAPLPNPLFEAIDTNGDGEISRTELRRAVAQLRKLDLNGDGVITLAEASPQVGPGGPQGGQVAFQGGPNALPGGQGPFQAGHAAGGLNAEQQQMMGRMMQFDRDRNGVLSLDEVPPQARGMLNDFNNDGRLDPGELHMNLQQNGDRMRAVWARGAGRQNGGARAADPNADDKPLGRRGRNE